MSLPMRVALEALNLAALAALRWASPSKSISIVMSLAQRVPPLGDAGAAREALEGLRRAGNGTCLSRAVVVAACLPGSEVVIGVDPWAGWIPAAHAWVEYGGHRLDDPAYDGQFAELLRMPMGDDGRDCLGYDAVTSTSREVS